MADSSEYAGLSTKHVADLRQRKSRKLFAAHATLTTASNRYALWFALACVTFPVAIILLLVSCPAAYNSNISYCSNVFTKQTGYLTSKKVDHCGTDDYHCGPVLTFSYSGMPTYDKGGNYTGYAGGKSCDIEQTGQETGCENKASPCYKPLWQAPLGSVRTIYASATGLCHFAKPLYDFFAGSIAMWIIFGFSFLQCCGGIMAGASAGAPILDPDSAASVEAVNAQRDRFDGVGVAAKGAPKLSVGIRKADCTDYVYADKRRAAMLSAHIVTNLKAYQPYAFVKLDASASLSPAIEPWLMQQLAGVCERANAKRAALRASVSQCPFLTLEERVGRLLNWQSAQNNALLSCLVVPVLLLLHLVAITLDALGNILCCCCSRRLARRAEWFEAVFAAHPEWCTFAIDDAVAEEVSALAAQAHATYGGSGAFVGFTTEEDEDYQASYDAGSSHYAHHYTFYDSFRVSVFGSADDLAKATKPGPAAAPGPDAYSSSSGGAREDEELPAVAAKAIAMPLQVEPGGESRV